MEKKKECNEVPVVTSGMKIYQTVYQFDREENLLL